MGLACDLWQSQHDVPFSKRSFTCILQIVRLDCGRNKNNSNNWPNKKKWKSQLKNKKKNHVLSYLIMFEDQVGICERCHIWQINIDRTILRRRSLTVVVWWWCAHQHRCRRCIWTGRATWSRWHRFLLYIRFVHIGFWLTIDCHSIWITNAWDTLIWNNIV